MRKRLFFIVLAVVFVAFLPVIFMNRRPYPSDENVKFCFEKLGITKFSWDTMVISSKKQADLPQGDLWNQFIKLEEWPDWSAPLHSEAKWISEPGFKVGGQFEQKLNLGFPAGQQTSKEIIGDLKDNESVAWWKEDKGIKSCHVWKFEKISDQKTVIDNIEVFKGYSIGFIKPFVKKSWQKLFDISTEGLKAKVTKIRISISPL